MGTTSRTNIGRCGIRGRPLGERTASSVYRWARTRAVSRTRRSLSRLKRMGTAPMLSSELCLLVMITVRLLLFGDPYAFDCCFALWFSATSPSDTFVAYTCLGLGACAL